MKTITQKFVPLIDTNNVIREENLDDIFMLTEGCYKIDGSPTLELFRGHGMNFGNVRYHVFANNRRCACCKIAITHVFLEDDPDNKDPNGQPIRIFNFYAETKDKSESDTSHLVLMTNNKHAGGTLCATCGFAMNALNCGWFELQQSLFNCYRIYRSSLSLRYSDSALEPAFRELTKNRKLIENVTQGLTKARPEAHEAMNAKIETAEARIVELEPRIEVARIEAQQTGVSVTTEQVKLM